VKPCTVIDYCYAKNPLKSYSKWLNGSHFVFLARDAFVQRIIALLPWCSSVRPSVCVFIYLCVWDWRALRSYGALEHGFKFMVG